MGVERPYWSFSLGDIVKKFLNLFLVLVLSLGGLNAEAKRMGAGRSVGQQSSNVTQREAVKPAAPAQQAAAAGVAKPAIPAAAPAKKPWGAMLGGLAAGLGLAWLAHSLGMGEAMGNILMFGLLAFAAMALIGWFMRKRQAGGAMGSGGLAYQGAGNTAAWLIKARATPQPRLKCCASTTLKKWATTPRRVLGRRTPRLSTAPRLRPRVP